MLTSLGLFPMCQMTYDTYLSGLPHGRNETMQMNHFPWHLPFPRVLSVYSTAADL